MLQRWFKLSCTRRGWGCCGTAPKQPRRTAKRWPISCLDTISGFWAGAAAFFQGWAKWSDGAEQSRLAEMRKGIETIRQQGSVWGLANLEAALAEAQASAETAAALRRLDDAFAELERTENRWYEAEMH